MKKFNWLHLSDLHMGCPKNEDFWPHIKKDIFRDVSKLYDLSGGLDFVLFSGDLTYSGKKEQFDAATDFLHELWRKFDELGSKPLLLCVPGNHDLVRPVSLPASARMLTMWGDQPDVRKEFWDETSEYYQFVENIFSNYQSWYRDIEIPKPVEVQAGLVPGDFSAQFSVNGGRVGVVGLNSAFLHFSDIDPAMNRVALSLKQLNYVTESDPSGWSDLNEISLLLSHHGPAWLCDDSLTEYRSGIYNPSVFYAHFYGHMHTSYDQSTSEGGCAERRMRQGISLFGLETTSSGEERLHGYAYYSLNIDDDRLEERVKPRTTTVLQNGIIKIIPNHEYDLDEDNALTRVFHIGEREEKDSVEIEEDNLVTRDDAPLANEFSNDILNTIGSDVPQFDIRHSSIRTSEQQRAIQLLQETGVLWLKCDWGMGKEGFLGTLFKNTILEGAYTFRLDFDDIRSSDGLLRRFRERFGIDFEQFITNIPHDKRVVFILDNIGSEFITKYDSDLFNKVSILKEFHGDSKYICTSRYGSTSFKDNFVELTTLDVFDVKSYISSHPSATSDMLSEDCIDTIMVKSGHVPMIIDRVIDQLSVISLNEIYTIESAFDVVGEDQSKPVTKALKYAISSLSDSDDDVLQRCYRLLKVLAFLPSGESLRTVKYAYQRKPFYPDHAVHLQKLSLITSTATPISLKLQSGAWLAVVDPSERLLRVSRQIREYIIATMPPREREDTVKRVADLLFGQKWRQGILKMAKVKVLSGRGAKAFGPGNEHEVVKHILSRAAGSQNDKEIDAALRIAASYCSNIRKSDRNRDALLASKEILTMAEGVESDYVGSLCLTHGSSMRMLGRRRAAIDYFNDALENELVKQNDDLISVYLNLALAHQAEGDEKEAITAAQHVQKYAKKGSASFTQAESIIVEVEKGLDALVDLEIEARNRGYNVVANNMAYDLAKDTDDSEEKLKYLNKIILSGDDNYNVIRAAADKIIHLADIDELSKIDNRTKQIVRYGYSLQFSQRSLNMFNKCHSALWIALKADNKINDLLRVFRLSSLVWRLSESSDTEQKYFAELNDIVTSSKKTKFSNIMDYQYFLIRVKALLN